MYTSNGTSYLYNIPVEMIEDSNLDTDNYYGKLRPIIKHHAIGSAFEQLCRSVENPAGSGYADYGNTECILMETWTLPDMVHLVGKYKNTIQSGSSVVSGPAAHPYTIYYNQANPRTPEFVRNDAKTISVDSSYRLLSYGFAESTGWGVNSQWELTGSGSYSTTPLAMRINLKQLFSLAKTKFPTDTSLYIVMDIIGIIKKGIGDSKLDTGAGMQVLLSERRQYSGGGSLTNSVAFKKSSSAYNLGAGTIMQVTPTQTTRTMFTAHGVLLGRTLGGSTDYSSANTWELDFTPIIPTHTETTQQGTNYGIWRPSMRISVCCKRP